MRHLRNRLGQIALMLALAAGTQAASGTVGMLPRVLRLPPAAEEARQAAVRGDGAWTQAWQTRNADLMASLFAADGVELGRGGAVTRGPKAIARRFARLFGATGPVQASRQMTDFWEVGGAAYEAGYYTFTLAPARPGQPPRQATGTYVTVWQKQPGGSWLIHSNVAVAAPQQAQ